MSDIIFSQLLACSEPDFQAFQCRLCPTISPELILGVRAPTLQRLAKTLYKSGEADAFLNALPHRYLEEYLLHGYCINLEKDFARAVEQTHRYLPYVDNWMTCDLLAPKVFARNTAALLPHVQGWLASHEEFTLRFGIGMLMRFYLDAAFQPQFLEQVANIRHDALYVRLMVAWYFATALAKQPDFALPYLQQQRLPLWTHNKTIQKAVESFRISPEQKQYLKTLRRHTESAQEIDSL